MTRPTGRRNAGPPLRAIALALALAMIGVVATSWAISLRARFIISQEDEVRRIVAEAMADANYRHALLTTGTPGAGRSPAVIPIPDSTRPWSTFTDSTHGAKRVGAYTAESGLATHRVTDSTGWPMLALAYTARERRSKIDELVWGVQTPLHYRNSDTPPGQLPYGHLVALPLRPVWPGFIVNTLAYAVPLWLALLTLSAARRLHRRRRDHCPGCNYNRRGLPSPETPCPECGTPS